MSSDLGNNPERDSRSDARKAEPTGTPRLEDIASSHASIAEARIQHARGVLKTEGFSAEQIDTIQERFFGNELRVYRPQFGERVSDVAKAMIELRDFSTVPVIARFGSVLLIAELGSTAHSVFEQYTAEVKRESEAYWTPARLAAKAAEEKAKADHAESRLKELPDFFKVWVNQCGDRNYGRVINILIAADAQLVADRLKTEQDIRAWYKLPLENQRNIVPGLSSGHTGMSFAQVVGLAIDYVEEASDRSSNSSRR